MKYAILAVLALSSFAVAQKMPENVAKNIDVCSSVADASGLTGCEQAVIDGYQTKAQLLQTQAGMLQQQFNSIQTLLSSTIELIKKNHPNMTYVAPSQQFPNGQLVPTTKPAEVKKPTPPAAK